MRDEGNANLKKTAVKTQPSEHNFLNEFPDIDKKLEYDFWSYV
jgi:hypothetical protein